MKRLLLLLLLLPAGMAMGQFFNTASFSLKDWPRDFPMTQWVADYSDRIYFADLFHDGNQSGAFSSFRLLKKPLKRVTLPGTGIEIEFDVSQGSTGRYGKLPTSQMKYAWPLWHYYFLDFNTFEEEDLYSYFIAGVERLHLSDEAVLAHCFNHFLEYEEGKTKRQLFVELANAYTGLTHDPVALKDASLKELMELYNKWDKRGSRYVVYNLFLKKKDREEALRLYERFFDPLLNNGNNFNYISRDQLAKTFEFTNLPIFIYIDPAVWKKEKELKPLWKKFGKEEKVKLMQAEGLTAKLYPTLDGYEMQFAFRGEWADGVKDVGDPSSTTHLKITYSAKQVEVGVGGSVFKPQFIKTMKYSTSK